ncbi:hypothetical protein FDP41_005666 [Naegleria fowleri]|uniref:Uncharacterized protein n=1 Tax=Naegleria fowleri TaxID=5763 RepID=A0A6A5BP31_NAEFO|nr:uncharacterized protein FDP41_005666 [Naegleria fowleri]KAF0975295.1 hypothetical protein FDP41_005666 [Naegleria fowleri]
MILGLMNASKVMLVGFSSSSFESMQQRIVSNSERCMFKNQSTKMSTSNPSAKLTSSSLNDLQSRLAKLQQNISQKLSKTSAAALSTTSSSLDHGVPQQPTTSVASSTSSSQTKSKSLHPREKA